MIARILRRSMAVDGINLDHFDTVVTYYDSGQYSVLCVPTCSRGGWGAGKAICNNEQSLLLINLSHHTSIYKYNINGDAS